MEGVKHMKTQYITEFINEFGQVNVYSVLCKIHELYRFKLYRVAEKWINELYEISINTAYENVNADLFFMTFDETCDMHLLINAISEKLCRR